MKRNAIERPFSMLSDSPASAYALTCKPTERSKPSERLANPRIVIDDNDGRPGSHRSRSMQ
jgi:hypothetical protein